MSHFHITQFAANHDPAVHEQLSELADAITNVDGIERCRVLSGDRHTILMTEFHEFGAFDRLQEDAAVRAARIGIRAMVEETDWWTGFGPTTA